MPVVELVVGVRVLFADGEVAGVEGPGADVVARVSQRGEVVVGVVAVLGGELIAVGFANEAVAGVERVRGGVGFGVGLGDERAMGVVGKLALGAFLLFLADLPTVKLVYYRSHYLAVPRSRFSAMDDVIQHSFRVSNDFLQHHKQIGLVWRKNVNSHNIQVFYPMVPRTSLTTAAVFGLVAALIAIYHKKEDKHSSQSPEKPSISQVKPAASAPIEKEYSYDDLMRGKAPEPSDEDLRNWVKQQDHSESAWVAAVAFRFDSSINNKWLAEGLSYNPDSKSLVMRAGNLELMQFHSHPEPTTTLKWVDHFTAIDPDNSLPWLMSAVAEYIRGDIEKGDEHWIRAGQASEMRVYGADYDESVQEFLLEHLGASQSVAELFGSASIPVLNIPNLRPENMKEIIDRAVSYRDSGLVAKGDELIDAGCQIGINLCEVNDSGLNTVYILLGAYIYETFIEAAPFETQLALAENTADIERLREVFRKSNEPRVENFSEAEFLWWNATRQKVGSLAAREMFAK